MLSLDPYNIILEFHHSLEILEWKEILKISKRKKNKKKINQRREKIKKEKVVTALNSDYLYKWDIVIYAQHKS